MTTPADPKARPGIRIRTMLHERLALTAALLTSSLNLFHLNRVGVNGLGNPYYAAGIQSMLTGWRNFFFLAFDPAGFLMLDKGPGAPWIQALSAKLFGFRGLSLLLPQALAGILSVYVLYRLVRRAYGAWSGLLAALVLAIMPISVVTNRTNFPDAWLTLSLLLAAWAVTRSVEEGSLGWLLLAGGFVGLGFNIKMLQILLAVPALVALYLSCSPLPWPRRLKHAGLALLVTVLVSAPWVLAVELTPADRRPYVGGSATNSVLELIFSYNGIQRLWGQDFSYFLGPPGPLRLLNARLGGQVSWLLPLALIGPVLTTLQARRRSEPPQERSRRRGARVLWTAWLLPQLIYFSVSTFYHRYYLATMAPAIAALVGIGAEALRSAWQSGGRQRWWGAMALLGCGGAQALILSRHPEWSRWLLPAMLGLCLATAIVLILPKRFVLTSTVKRRTHLVFTIGILALCIAPTVWAAIPVITCTDMTLPYAGPQTRKCRPFEIRPFLDPGLIAYLEQQRDGAEFMAATYDLGIAEMGILETGEPFMALGGYRGSDPILILDQFERLVAEGKVRFFLSLEEPGERWPQQEPILQWVEDHCPLCSINVEGIEVRGPCRATE